MNATAMLMHVLHSGRNVYRLLEMMSYSRSHYESEQLEVKWPWYTYSSWDPADLSSTIICGGWHFPKDEAKKILMMTGNPL
jgi:hypothetical protein